MKFLKIPRVPQQVRSLCVVFFIIVVGFFVARWFFIPPTFGLYGHYRAKAIEEIKAQPIVYAGAKACRDCHDDIYTLKENSYHRDVSCETCHGPAAQHAEDPGSVSPRLPRERKDCTVCHEYSAARPTGFPQIIESKHNTGKACISCHVAHNPLLPHTPEQCSACHREIYMKKAVSPHSVLECTTCHTVPDVHLTNPRANEVGKPQAREFCSKCHAQDAQPPKEISKEIPRIDIKTHGERYLCWECHYPHSPGVDR